MKGVNMKKSTTIKLVAAAVLLAATVIFALLGNEAVFPSTLIGFFLALSLIVTDDFNQSAAGKAARNAVVVFSILVIILNIGVTIFLPVVSASSDLSDYSVELTTNIGTTDTAAVADHFVAVTINDMHELCYSTSILLLINIALQFVYRSAIMKMRRNNAEPTPQ
jgi:hypothetical protein